MIAIVSSSHFPDDERIYYKQICSLLDIGKKIVYFTKSFINKFRSNTYAILVASGENNGS